MPKLRSGGDHGVHTTFAFVVGGRVVDRRVVSGSRSVVRGLVVNGDVVTLSGTEVPSLSTTGSGAERVKRAAATSASTTSTAAAPITASLAPLPLPLPLGVG